MRGVDGDHVPSIVEPFGERCLPAGVPAPGTECSFERDVVRVGHEVQYFSKLLPLKVTVESGDDDVFAVLHHECHCDAEIAEELTFVDGDDVVLPGPHQKKFRRFNRFQPLPVVVLHARSLVVGVVDDQAAHADRGESIYPAHEFRTFAAVHRTKDEFQ